jgi:hypothetical protein
MSWMKRAWLAVVAAMVLGAGSAGAAEPPAEDPLAALKWLAGGTWVAEISGAEGRPLRVECRFDWAGHGRTLKYVIHFKSGETIVTQYEGMYYWHPGKKHIAMIQVDRSGNVTESVVKAEGAAIRQENQATQADGTTRPQRVRVDREGEDAFRFTAQVQRDGQWVDAVGFTYKRER